MKKILNNRILKIIFVLRNRENHVEKYFKNILNDSMSYDILIISENNKNINLKGLKNIYKFHITNKINGMNSIFSQMYKFRNFIKKYKYVCFVEDDNFIFNDGLKACRTFLDQNNNYVACNGKSFLYTKKNKTFYFLNSYITPKFEGSSAMKRLEKYNRTMGLVYYSLIRSVIFLKICKKISRIKDDNLSEIYFNYLLIIFGNLKNLNILYLARLYPRPKIYNIPKLNFWVKKNLSKDISYIFQDLSKELKNRKNKNYNEKFLNESMFKYLSIRMNPNNKKINFFSKVRLNIDYFFLKHNQKCINFINNQNS